MGHSPRPTTSYRDTYEAGKIAGYRAALEEAAKVCEKYRDALERNGDTWVATCANQCAFRIRALIEEQK